MFFFSSPSFTRLVVNVQSFPLQLRWVSGSCSHVETCSQWNMVLPFVWYCLGIKYFDMKRSIDMLGFISYNILQNRVTPLRDMSNWLLIVHSICLFTLSCPHMFPMYKYYPVFTTPFKHKRYTCREKKWIQNALHVNENKRQRKTKGQSRMSNPETQTVPSYLWRGDLLIYSKGYFLIECMNR